jgi:signal peptidase I
MVIFITLFTFVVRTTAVDGTSMLPTLKHDDDMLVINFFYTPNPGDVVVLYAPNLYDSNNNGYGKNVIKRVIGVENDVILIERETGLVYRNGEALDPIEYGVLTDSNRHDDLLVTVPKGHIFVLGDNRSRGGSTDSRCSSIGLVDVNYVYGRAFFRWASLREFGFIV